MRAIIPFRKALAMVPQSTVWAPLCFWLIMVVVGAEDGMCRMAGTCGRPDLDGISFLLPVDRQEFIEGEVVMIEIISSKSIEGTLL